MTLSIRSFLLDILVAHGFHSRVGMLRRGYNEADPGRRLQNINL